MIHRYGTTFSDTSTDLEIEIGMIRRNGQWISKGKTIGEGLFYHYRRLQTLLWPEDDHHRWSDLILSEILKNTITAILGPKDSCKTHSVAKFGLCDYICWPDETLILISSTDLRGLEMRVWGDLKSLFDRAKNRWDELIPGHVIDSKHAICTDNLDDESVVVRDMRKGILCIPCIGSSGQFTGLSKYVGMKQKRRRLLADECFPAGTMVDTPSGPTAIETLLPGQRVYNHIGIWPIKATRCSMADSLVMVYSSCGRSVTCTPEHPFLTNQGWVLAKYLNNSHYLCPPMMGKSIGGWVTHVLETKCKPVLVYNLQVEGHPSYSVNGFIVHNCQFMKDAFLESLANLNSGDFKGVFMGNPLGQDDPLDKVSEPVEGWTSMPEPDKTATWNNRFMNGRTINLVGTDSPNFDIPGTTKYPYMVNSDSIARVVSFYGRDSSQYFSQCKGVRKSGINARRVITRELCEQFHAFDDVDWGEGKMTTIGALDAAYGGIGGDRCVLGHIKFGACVDEKIRIFCYPPVMVPVSAKLTKRPEDQIAEYVKNYCTLNGVSEDNFFYDSTGRGSLGPALARIWGPNIQPVEFGGAATSRPVSAELMMWDPKTREKRPKLCNEQYSKFVTELWFSARYIIEADQMRGLPRDVAQEGYLREWMLVRGDRIEIETKEDMRERTNRSPDLMDWLVTAIEGARRRGFSIGRVTSAEYQQTGLEWLRKLADTHKKLRVAHDLNYAA